MNPDITQDTLYLILPSKVSRMAEMLAADTGKEHRLGRERDIHV